jgi:hypothetical protein
MKRIILLVALGLLLAGLAVPVLIFLNRPPVLVVTNVSFAELYGVDRAHRQRVLASIELRRPVKPVMIADDATSDVLVIAVSNAAEKPFCVLFSSIHTDAAKLYHEEFPEIPVVVLTGRVRASLPSADGVLCVYGTDRGTDMYRAGLMAGIRSVAVRDAARKAAEEASEGGEPEEIKKDIALHLDRSITTADRELFSKGVGEEDPESEVKFVRASAEMPDSGRLSCAVIAGGGNDYLEKNPPIPLVLFTWTDPAFVCSEVAVIFDDSPWALAVPAVRMAVGNPAGDLAGGLAGGLAEGKIPSKPLILSGGFVDNKISGRLKISAKKNPE